MKIKRFKVKRFYIKCINLSNGFYILIFIFFLHEHVLKYILKKKLIVFQYNIQAYNI